MAHNIDSRIYSDEIINILRRHVASRISSSRRPIFVFLCGGASDRFNSRNLVAEYVQNSQNPKLKNVFCVTAENIASLNVFSDMDLLLQEALIADVSDCIILFCESPGSYCELGAFTALPSVRTILTVAVDKKYKGEGAEGFLVKGPIADLEKRAYQSSLTNVFYVDITCPITSPDFMEYLTDIRTQVSNLRNRKTVEDIAGNGTVSVKVGSLALELLDLVNLLAPIRGDDLEVIYRRVKGIGSRKIKIESPTISMSLASIKNSIEYSSVLSFMSAMRMIRAQEGSDPSTNILETSYYPIIHPDEPFMFKSTGEQDYRHIAAQVLLRKRKMGIKGADDVYHRFDY